VSQNDYRGTHQAPTDDGYSARLDQLDAIVPDVYDRLEDHDGGNDTQTRAALDIARGRPDAHITVYRSMPANHHQLNRGDWVSLSASYAADEGKHPEEPDLDFPVREYRVRASQIWWDANSLFEFGYDGPTLTQEPG
jgi:hypothetical protein